MHTSGGVKLGQDACWRSGTLLFGVPPPTVAAAYVGVRKHARSHLLRFQPGCLKDGVGTRCWHTAGRQSDAQALSPSLPRPFLSFSLLLRSENNAGQPKQNAEP